MSYSSRLYFAAGIICLCSMGFAQTATLESDLLRLELNTGSAYSYQIIEKSTGNVLVEQNRTRFTVGGATYGVTSASGVTTMGNTMTATLGLSGTTATGQVQYTFTESGVLQVVLTHDSGSPTKIAERFDDKGEHYYGLFEQPFGNSALGNRGISRDLLGYFYADDVNFANARAPFYVTDRNYGIYVDTVAKGRYSMGVSGNTEFSFEQPQLTYHFLHGSAPKQVMQKYNTVAGGAYVPPDWALGTIFWRDDHHKDPVSSGANAQTRVIEDADKLRSHRIHASAMWIDRPYTTGDWGWGGLDDDSKFEFDTSFPDPAQMVSDVNARGMQLMLWIANRTHNELKEEGEDNGYLFDGYTESPAADMRDSDARDWFQDRLDSLVELGVKGYKIDRGHNNEMPLSVENENVYLFQKMASEGFTDVGVNDAFVFARNTFDKSRQYCAVWNGDTDCNWGGMQASMKNGLRCSMINFPMWGSDAGGYRGTPSKELFARWSGFTAYSPMMSILIGPGRTIWDDYDQEMIDIVREHAETRHRLIPYLRSALYQASQTGVGVMRPMLMEFPDDANTDDMWDQYMYGDALLVAPVCEGGLTSRNVYLPEGKWMNYDEKTIHDGNQTISANAPLGRVPVFVRIGAIVVRGDVLQANDNWTENWSPSLQIEVFLPDALAGNAFDYYTGSEVRTITYDKDENGIVVSFSDLGIDGVIELYLDETTYGLLDDGTYGVYMDGVLLNEQDYQFGPATNFLSVGYAGQTDLLITIPEPATLTLLGIGLVGVVLRRKRR